MKKKEKKLKKLGDDLLYVFVRVVYIIVTRLSRKRAMRLSASLGSILYHMVKGVRKTIQHNLKFIYNGALAEEKMDAITREIFTCQVKNQIEFLIYKNPEASRLEELVSVENIHYIDEALNEKRGLLLLTAHFGEWGVGLTRLADMGYGVHVIIRPFSNRRIYSFVENLYGSRKIFLVPRGEKSKEIYLKLLSGNNILTTAVDQHAQEKGITIPFMGKPAQTACGWVVLAKKTKTPVLVSMCAREPDDRYRLIIENPGPLQFTENLEKDLYENTLKINKIIESYIYKYPEQWYWMHKRWRPSAANTLQNNTTAALAKP